MKKKIIIYIFSALIILTAIIFFILAIDTYAYEAKNDDILVGLGAAIVMVIGGFTVLYEFDLFYVVYYFFIKPRSKAKSVLNVLSNVSLILIFAYTFLSDVFMELRKYEFTPLVLFAIYIILRMLYLIVCGIQANKEIKEQ